MAIGDDFSVAANGDIRYTGSGTNYTVIAATATYLALRWSRAKRSEEAAHLRDELQVHAVEDLVAPIIQRGRDLLEQRYRAAESNPRRALALLKLPWRHREDLRTALSSSR